jgi:hypothetical protein
MTARKLDKSQWRTFFDRPSKTLEGKQAEIELPRYPLAIRSRRSGCPCTRGARGSDGGGWSENEQ